LVFVVFKWFLRAKIRKKDGRHKKTMHFVRKTFIFQKK